MRENWLNMGGYSPMEDVQINYWKVSGGYFVEEINGGTVVGFERLKDDDEDYQKLLGLIDRKLEARERLKRLKK